VQKRLNALSKSLGDKPWLDGDRFTAGDLMMSTVLRILKHTDIVTSDKRLAAYIERCTARPAFRRALDAQIDIQNLRTHEALVNYKKMIVGAVAEVENALSAYSAEQDRLEDLNDAMVASQRAVTLANERYDRGLTDFLNVTDAERQLYEIQDQYAIAREDVVVQYIAIYKSLGGGWEDYQKIPPIRKPQPAIVAGVREIISPDEAPK